MKKMKTGCTFLFFVLAVSALLLGGCDMTLIGGGPATPGAAGGQGTTIEDKVADLEKNGHYLMLYHLPAGVIREAVKPVSVSDGSANLAFTDTSSETLLAPDSVYINAYIPLSAAGGGVWNRNGSFIVAFSVQIDALTKITVSKSDNVIVLFSDGKGTLDIEKLIKNNPGVVDTEPDPETEEEIENIIAGGGYIRFFNLPRNVSKNSFSAVSVSSASGIIAKPGDYETIAVRKNVLTAEAFVPVTSSRDSQRFSESGSFYVAYSVTADAVTQIIVHPSFALLYLFDDGSADVDVAESPQAPSKPPVVPHSLSLGGLPAVTSAANITDVFLYNSAGIVAKCPDYLRVYLTPYNGKKTAVIPLVYDNNKAFNGREFAESGNFFVTFTVYPEAGQVINVTLENGCLVPFTDGNAFLDVSNIPPVPRNCLTITNLPANFQELNLANLFIYNQAGKVAQCQDYGLLEITREGGSSTVRIPLVYINDNSRIFEETGPYYVSFDMNVDALTRIVITEADKVIASFQDGRGTLDASKLPQALPLPYFTITGLPRNTVKGNFADVFLYNAAGAVAKCSDYNTIVISKGNGSASAMIPLVYSSNAKEFFRDSGEFVVTFTINIDINTQIIKARTDSLVVEFTDGSGELNLSSDYGYFSGGLTNPSDTSPPVIKGGTVFEMNGGYIKVQSNTPVDAAEFPSSRVVYVYAAKKSGLLSFVYSDTAPAWDAARNGWYLGDRRALFKTVYLKDTVTRYVAKAFITDSWKNFDSYMVDNLIISNVGDREVHSLNGASDPAVQQYAPEAGWYILRVAGAGGGGGGGVDGKDSWNRYGGTGGAGGYAAELVYFDGNPLTLFTGSGGYGSGSISYGYRQSCGGGGGGSGTFVYSPDGYFLCAGGGGGGGGGAAWILSSGAGGAGGSTGSGGGGGVGGSIYGPTTTTFTSPYVPSGGSGGAEWGSQGGKGGGGGGGAAGYASVHGSYTTEGYCSPINGSGGTAHGASTHYGYQGGTSNTNNFSWTSIYNKYDIRTSGSGGGGAAYTQYAFPDEWKNTNGANGSGASGTTEGSGYSGGAGGNNRNTLRGGGAGGGSGGIPSDSAASAGGRGGAGSVTFFKLAE